MPGTEQPLMNTLNSCCDYFELIKSKKPSFALKPPQRYQLRDKPIDFYGSGTVNHKFLRITVDLCLAYIYNDTDYIHVCELRLLNFLREQELRGHCCVANAIETLSSTHGQLNLAAASVAYLFWSYFGVNNSLGTLLIHWHWSEVSLFQHCKLPEKYLSDNGYTPTFHTSGWRALKGEKGKDEDNDGDLNGIIVTYNPGRDLYGRIMLGLSYPKDNRKLYNNKYNLGARAVLLLSSTDREKLLPPPDWKAPVPYEYAISINNKGNFISGFNAPPNKDICLVTAYNTNDKIETMPEGDIKKIFAANWDSILVFPATEWSKKNRIQP